jgi:hypothetical protein
MLGDVLLAHHRTIRQARTTTTITPDNMLTYGDLCRDAGLDFLTRRVGHFLCQIAEWCATKGLPPLNSLAVNGRVEETRPRLRRGAGLQRNRMVG